MKKGRKPLTSSHRRYRDLPYHPEMRRIRYFDNAAKVLFQGMRGKEFSLRDENGIERRYRIERYAYRSHLCDLRGKNGYFAVWLQVTARPGERNGASASRAPWQGSLRIECRYRERKPVQFEVSLFPRSGQKIDLGAPVPIQREPAVAILTRPYRSVWTRLMADAPDP